MKTNIWVLPIDPPQTRVLFLPIWNAMYQD